VLGLLFVLFRSGLGEKIDHYGLYILIGVVHYTHFTNATTAAMQILYARIALTRNTVFPKDVLVLAAVLTNTIDFLLSMMICVAIAFLSGIAPSRALAALPLVFVMQMLLVVWVSLLLAGVYVYVRDLAHVYQVFLRLLFFVTPIFYSLSFVGDGLARYVVMANPLTHAILLSRALIIEGRLIDVNAFGVLLAGNAVLVYLAYKVFKKLEPTFAEHV
jgi:ABC-2 type transport system permease protein